MDEQDRQDEKRKIINPVYPVYQCVSGERQAYRRASVQADMGKTEK
jgi:hypothetical protein